MRLQMLDFLLALFCELHLVGEFLLHDEPLPPFRCFCLCRLLALQASIRHLVLNYFQFIFGEPAVAIPGLALPADGVQLGLQDLHTTAQLQHLLDGCLCDFSISAHARCREILLI